MAIIWQSEGPGQYLHNGQFKRRVVGKLQINFENGKSDYIITLNLHAIYSPAVCYPLHLTVYILCVLIYSHSSHCGKLQSFSPFNMYGNHTFSSFSLPSLIIHFHRRPVTTPQLVLHRIRTFVPELN